MVLNLISRRENTRSPHAPTFTAISQLIIKLFLNLLRAQPIFDLVRAHLEDEDGAARNLHEACFEVQGSGFRVQGSGSRVQGSGFLQGLGVSLQRRQRAATRLQRRPPPPRMLVGCPPGVEALRFGGSGLDGSGFRVQGPGFRVQGSGFRAQGSEFRVQGSGFRAHLSTPCSSGRKDPPPLPPSGGVRGGGRGAREREAEEDGGVEEGEVRDVEARPRHACCAHPHTHTLTHTLSLSHTHTHTHDLPYRLWG